MEVIGAVASIAQVAQLGAQLSLTLYRIAQGIGTANKEVRSIAKDISLFSAVLKGLGTVLENGQQLQLYRADAYKTSLLIIKECNGVFSEIEAILYKTSKDAHGPRAGISLDRSEKFMWFFRKSQVQVLRGNLESLKSTILVELAVLNCAEKMSPRHLDQTHIAVEDILALKSLVVANQIATQEFRDLLSSTSDGTAPAGPLRGPIAKLGIGSWDSNSSQEDRSKPVKVTAAQQSHSLAAIGVGLANQTPPLSSISTDQTDRAAPIARSGVKVLSPTTTTCVEIRTTESSSRYREVWNILDRLAFALAKVDLATWEDERIKDRLAKSSSEDLKESHDAIEYFTTRLQQSLFKLGMTRRTVDRVIMMCQNEELQQGMRVPVEHKRYSTLKDRQALRDLGIVWRESKRDTDSITIRRWMPDFLDDILWEHISRSIDKPMVDVGNDSSSFSLPKRDKSGHVQLVHGLHQRRDLSNVSFSTVVEDEGITVTPSSSAREPTSKVQKSVRSDTDALEPRPCLTTQSDRLSRDEPTHITEARKRTKLGCLTCRRRRIECGEEKPTCTNCVKSRRSCEGYGTRLIFRDPVSIEHFGCRPLFGGPSDVPKVDGVTKQIARSTDGGQLPAILPRPIPASSVPLKLAQSDSQYGSQEHMRIGDWHDKVREEREWKEGRETRNSKSYQYHNREETIEKRTRQDERSRLPSRRGRRYSASGIEDWDNEFDEQRKEPQQQGPWERHRPLHNSRANRSHTRGEEHLLGELDTTQTRRFTQSPSPSRLAEVHRRCRKEANEQLERAEPKTLERERIEKRESRLGRSQAGELIKSRENVEEDVTIRRATTLLQREAEDSERDLDSTDKIIEDLFLKWTYLDAPLGAGES